MHLNELQLDALREMSNIGSGNAATSLAEMIGLPVELSVPTVSVLSLADAVDAAGAAEDETNAVVIPIFGDLEATVLLLFSNSGRESLCGLLGVAGDPEMELSCLGEIGNILGSAYVGAIGMMAGLDLEPEPPVTLNDMLGAVVSTALMATALDTDTALLLDSHLEVDSTACDFGFLLVPSSAGVAILLERLGLGDAEAA
jgi:chemotaxis protein CheC